MPNDSAYLKHLEFIQAIVARMTQSSVQTKSLLLPVVVATYGYALTQKSVSVSLLGIAAVLLFWLYRRQLSAARTSLPEAL